MLSREKTLRHPVGTGSDDRHYARNSSQLPAEKMIVRLKPVVTSGDFKKGETLSVSKKKRGEDVRMAVDADGTGEVRNVVEYRVDKAFGPGSGDTEVYEAAAAGLVDRALCGGNGLLLLAGTPRSDGCLTMWKPAAPPRTTLEGILPSALADLTRRWRGGSEQSNLPRQRLAKVKMRAKATTEAFPSIVMRLCVAEIWGGVDGGTRDLLKDSDADNCKGREPDASFSPKEVVTDSHARCLEERSSGATSDGRLSPGGGMEKRGETAAIPKGSADTKTATTALLTAGVLVGVTETTVDGLDRALSLIGECQERRTKDRRGHLVVAVKLVVPTAANEMGTTTDYRPATGEVVFVEMGDCPGGDLPRNLLAALEHLKISKHLGTKRDRTSERSSDDPLRALFGCLASGGLWVSPTRRSGRDLLRTAGVPLEVSVMATLDSGSGFREEKMAVLEALARSTRTRPKSCPSFKQILESIPMFACGSRTLSVDAVPSSVTPPTALSSKDTVRFFVRSLSSSASVSTCPLTVEASQDDDEGNGHSHPRRHPDRSGGSSELSVTAMEVVKVDGATERGVDSSVEDVGGQDDEAVRVGSDSIGLGKGHTGRSEGGFSDGGRGGIVPEMALRITTEEATEGDNGGRCMSNGEFDGVGDVGLAVGRHEGEEMARNSLTTPRHLECSEPEADGIEELMDKEQRETPGPDCERPLLRLLLLPADELARRVLQAEEASNYWKTQHALAEQELAKLRARLGRDNYGVNIGESSGSPDSESVKRVVVQGDKSHRGMRLANAAFGNRCASLPMEAVSRGMIDCGGILRRSVGGETKTTVTPSRLTFEERRALFCVKEKRASARSSVVARPRRSTISVLPRESEVSLGVEGAGVRKGFKRRSLLLNRVTDCVIPAETKRAAAVVPPASPGDDFADRVNSGTPASDGGQTFSDLSVDRPSENPALSSLQMTSDSESVSMAVDEASSAPVTTAAATNAIPRECSSATNPTRPASSGSRHLLTAAEIPPVVLTSKGNEGLSELPDLDSPCSSFFSPPLLSPPFFPKPIAQGLARRTGAATFQKESSFRRPLSSWYGIQKRRDRSWMRPDEERRSRTWSVDRGANARRGLANALRMASLSRSLSSEGSSMSPASSSGAAAAVSSAGAVAFSSSSSSSASSMSSSPESSSVFYGGQSRLPDNIMSPDSAAAAAAAAGALEMTASLASGITTRECAEFFWGGDVLRRRQSQEGSPEQGWKKSLISFSFPKASSSVPEPRVSPDSRNDDKI